MQLKKKTTSSYRGQWPIDWEPLGDQAKEKRIMSPSWWADDRWEPWCNVCTMRHRLVSARGNAAAYDRKYFPRSIRIRRARDGSLLKDRHHRTWPCVRRKIPVLALQLENVPDSRNTDIHHISMIRDTISRRHLRSTEYRCYFLMASRTSSQDTPENYDREF